MVVHKELRKMHQKLLKDIALGGGLDCCADTPKALEKYFKLLRKTRAKFVFTFAEENWRAYSTIVCSKVLSDNADIILSKRNKYQIQARDFVASLFGAFWTDSSRFHRDWMVNWNYTFNKPAIKEIYQANRPYIDRELRMYLCMGEKSPEQLRVLAAWGINLKLKRAGNIVAAHICAQAKYKFPVVREVLSITKKDPRILDAILMRMLNTTGIQYSRITSLLKHYKDINECKLFQADFLNQYARDFGGFWVNNRDTFVHLLEQTGKLPMTGETKEMHEIYTKRLVEYGLTGETNGVTVVVGIKVLYVELLKSRASLKPAA